MGNRNVISDSQLLAAADYSGNQYYFVDYDSAGTVTLCSAIGQRAFVLLNKPVAGAPADPGPSDFFVGKLAAMVKDADNGQKRTILRVVRSLLRGGCSAGPRT